MLIIPQISRVESGTTFGWSSVAHFKFGNEVDLQALLNHPKGLIFLCAVSPTDSGACRVRDSQSLLAKPPTSSGSSMRVPYLGKSIALKYNDYSEVSISCIGVPTLTDSRVYQGIHCYDANGAFSVLTPHFSVINHNRVLRARANFIIFSRSCFYGCWQTTDYLLY